MCIFSRFSRRRILPVLSSSILAVILLTPFRPFSKENLSSRVPEWYPSAVPIEERPPSSIQLPQEYTTADEPKICQNRFGTSYLENLRDQTDQYCDISGRSSLTCFHSRAPDDSMDSFCLGENAAFYAADRKFALDCPLRHLSAQEKLEAVVEYDKLKLYSYDTGPRWVLNRFVDLNHRDDERNEEPTSNAGTKSVKLLVRREGVQDLWHCLMELFSMTLTIDALSIARDPASAKGSPLLSAGDLLNTQVIILDDLYEGPYWDLWSILTSNPPIRLKDFAAAQPSPISLENIVIPLAGASNPLWENEHLIRDCTQAPLLHTFTRRILAHYSIDAPSRSREKIVVTVIRRPGPRRLLFKDPLLQAIRVISPHVHIKDVDFAALSFETQVHIAQETDVLVGVYGEELAHAMFMPRGGAVVEILPEGVEYNGVRNLAVMLGLDYFRTHGHLTEDEGLEDVGEGRQQVSKNAIRPATGTTVTPVQKAFDHERSLLSDIFIEENRFVELVSAAVKSVYNKSGRNLDAN